MHLYVKGVDGVLGDGCVCKRVCKSMCVAVDLSLSECFNMSQSTETALGYPH